jgi:thioredoxin 1
VLVPVLGQIAVELAGKLRVARLNVDDSPYTAQQFGVMSIPTLILFRGGEEQGRVIGARDKEYIVRTLMGDVAA